MFLPFFLTPSLSLFSHFPMNKSDYRTVLLCQPANLDDLFTNIKKETGTKKNEKLQISQNTIQEKKLLLLLPNLNFALTKLTELT